MVRRQLLAGLLVAGWPFVGPTRGAAQDVGFNACLTGLRQQAAGKGIGVETFDRVTAGLTIDSSVVRARQRQPEFTTPIWDYLATLVDQERIADGKAKLTEWTSVLEAIEGDYAVDRHVVVAIWGVESDYGRVLGKRPLVRSLATGACSGRRRSFFKTQLFATLQIIELGEVPTEALVGSWAGAFGQTQFMPTTFLSRAVDGDGDGRRDLVHSVPDALASAANYLKVAGWNPRSPWGYEVRVPDNLSLRTGRRHKYPVARWRSVGLTRTDGSPVEGVGSAALLRPAGRNGPALLVFENFDALYSYNAAESYALAIGHLADRIRGDPPFTQPWPTDDRGLNRAERTELQRLLLDLGYDVGAPDGILGAKSRAAIRAFQTTIGLDPTGWGGGRLLDSLRAATNR